MREFTFADARARVVVTDRRDGDRAFGQAAVALGCERVVGVRQVHGSRVVSAKEGPAHGEPIEEADALYIPVGSALAGSVLTADCIPVVLATRERGLCVAHAGWPGLVAGVIESAFEALDGSEGVAAFVGPHIRPCCYEFKGEAATVVRERFGDTVFVGASLDLDRVLEQIFTRYGVTDFTVDPRCTGCSPELFSYRTEQTSERLVTAAALGGAQ